MSHPLQMAATWISQHAPDGAAKDEVLAVLDGWLATAAHADLRACKDCGTSFVLTAGQRAFFESQHLAYPVRCSHCRAARRAAQGQDR
jgi:hypothetical protein